MAKEKVCIDIGGTKTILAVLDDKLNIRKSIDYKTPQRRAQFLNELVKNLRVMKGLSSTVNISIAGRVNKDGKVIFCPNLPIKGVNLKGVVKRHFKNVYIDNDANCFAVYELFAGALRGRENGVIVVWGTGVGGSVIARGRIYRGAGLASELGHVKTMVKPHEDTEALIGGRWFKKNFHHTGAELQRLAVSGDKKAIKTFSKVGTIFGRYLSSISYLFDPEIVVIGGSFVNSWGFMKRAVTKAIREETLRGKLKIRVVGGKYYVIKGCYFLDRYAKLDNKL